jgi:hypothetical protein
MNTDLSDVLADWPYEPGQINVRVIRGINGEPKIQVRLDLGLLQMNLEGRPDGQRPNGCDSLLDYFERVLDGSLRLDPESLDPADSTPPTAPNAPPRKRQNAGDDGDIEFESVDDGDASELVLTPEQCKALRDEAAQYYHRYVALLVLEDFEAVVRDTSRNLRVAELCAEHAAEEEDRNALQQIRPYIHMMRARALASLSLRDDESKAAVLAIEIGLDAIRACYENAGDPSAFEESSEAQVLRSMREALLPKLPVSQKAELRERLRDALASENYELAAILRDELRLLDR